MNLPAKTIIVSLLVLLTACSVPLEKLDLEPLLVQSGDLPAGLFPAQVSNSPSLADGLPAPDNQIYQEFSDISGSAGGVTVFLYEDLDKANSSFDIIQAGMDGFVPSSGLWERAAASPGLGSGIAAIDFVFLKCHAVVYFLFENTANLDGAEAYATRLSERLEPLVCKP